MIRSTPGSLLHAAWRTRPGDLNQATSAVLKSVRGDGIAKVSAPLKTGLCGSRLPNLSDVAQFDPTHADLGNECNNTLGSDDLEPVHRCIEHGSSRRRLYSRRPLTYMDAPRLPSFQFVTTQTGLRLQPYIRTLNEALPLSLMEFADRAPWRADQSTTAE